jgi:hypothetical protein
MIRPASTSMTTPSRVPASRSTKRDQAATRPSPLMAVSPSPSRTSQRRAPVAVSMIPKPDPGSPPSPKQVSGASSRAREVSSRRSVTAMRMVPQGPSSIRPSWRPVAASRRRIPNPGGGPASPDALRSAACPAVGAQNALTSTSVPSLENCGNSRWTPGAGGRSVHATVPLGMSTTWTTSSPELNQ